MHKACSRADYSGCSALRNAPRALNLKLAERPLRHNRSRALRETFRASTPSVAKAARQQPTLRAALPADAAQGCGRSPAHPVTTARDAVPANSQQVRPPRSVEGHIHAVQELRGEQVGEHRSRPDPANDPSMTKLDRERCRRCESASPPAFSGPRLRGSDGSVCWRCSRPG